ncbi:MAG: hypothetical protein C5B60_11975 [Chloroflexi bacterium]|nr:MAG: hypothetical protein C5B60_11975 [Chloroflexota bacterium]
MLLMAVLTHSQIAQTAHSASKINERSQRVGVRFTENASTRGSYSVDRKTILIELRHMEVERRIGV